MKEVLTDADFAQILIEWKGDDEMKRVALFMGAVMLCVLFLFFPAERAEAASVKGIELKNRKNITKYDITGDGKKDTIRIDCEEPAEYDEACGDNWSVKVNGEVVYQDNPECYTETLSVVLYQVSSTVSYLHIQENVGSNDDINASAFYMFRDGEFTKICDVYEPLCKHVYRFHFYATPVKVTQKKIVMLYANQFSATGYISWNIEYCYKDGEWKKQGNVYALTEVKKMTVNRKFTVYKTAGGTEKAFTLKKAQKVRVKKICLKNKKTYVQLILPDGKKGWLESPSKSLPEKYYFKEVMFAG